MRTPQPVPADLVIYRRDTHTGALLTVHGEIDVDTAAQLRGSLTRCLLDDHPTIDVDLAGVSFCDSSGLHAFLDTSHAAAKAGGVLRLHNPGPIVDRLFTLTGTGTILLALSLGAGTAPAPEAARHASETRTRNHRPGQIVPFTTTATGPVHPDRSRAAQVRALLSGDLLRESLLGNPRASLTSALVRHAHRAAGEVVRSWLW